MLLHVDNIRFKVKPSGQEIGGIKSRFTKSASIKDVTAEQLAAALTTGRTVQPGVTPFSETSRKKGYKGTKDADFTRQTVFMNDIDNKRKDIPQETPAHIAEQLAKHNLKAVFMYETFNSTPEQVRFRYAVVCDEEITDRAERDRIQGAIIAMSGQSDIDCINADRIFFGTDKGLIDEYTDFTAVCSKADLLALADVYSLPGKSAQTAQGKQTGGNSKWTKYGETIPTGERHGTLVSFAASVLTKYGISEQAYNAYMERVAQCEEPKPDDEIEKIWRDACTHYQNKIAANPGYVQPAEYAAQEFAQTVEPTDYTDVGEARVFVSQYQDKARYSAATKWLVYNGMKWAESDLQAQALAQELTDKQLKEARTMLKKARGALDAAVESGDEDLQEDAKQEEERAKAYRSFVLGRRKTSRISATLTEARPALEIDVKQLDANPFLLNTPGGIVDLRTLKIKPHEPTDYCTKITAVAPTQDNMQLWQEFLDRITCGDKELQAYHQIVAGMSLVGKVFCENLIIAYGSGGNGKSTFYNAMFLALGDYAGSLSAETLTVNCRKNKSPEYAELRGKRFVIAAELEEGNRLDTAIVKKLCSTDPIKAEKKFKDPFEFLPSHTTILYTNHLPKVGTTDKGTWDRLVVVPFAGRFRGMQGEIKNYADYLYQHCGGAILLWMIQGAKKFIDAEYTVNQPESVKAAIEEYRQENDWMNNFISECCETGSEYKEKASSLFDAYKTYCAGLNEYVRHVSDFKAALTAAGHTWRKTKTGAYYYGLRLCGEYAPIVPL